MKPAAVVLYLHVHQPYRLRPYSVFDIASSHDYFITSNRTARYNNQQVFKKVAQKSYLPTNGLLLSLLKQYPEFRLSLSLTGTFLEQAKAWAPEVLQSFQALVATGRVEVAAETYYHSLAFFYDKTEFEHQVTLHQQKIYDLFGVKSQVFRNTELAYNDALASWADSHGFKGVLAEGWDKVLGWRSPNYIYRPPHTKQISLLLKNYRLSDDIAFRFSNRSWSQWPLTAKTYGQWAERSLQNGSLLNLFMDYETFGEHQWKETGIFDFLAAFVKTWLGNSRHTFYTLSQAIEQTKPAGELSIPHTLTWADTERDLTAWTGNSMQQEALKHLYALTSDILHTHDAQLIADWRKLQTSDHFYYMCTKWFNDGDVHAYFSPYDSPYDAFLYYLNAIRDLRYRLNKYRGLRG